MIIPKYSNSGSFRFTHTTLIFVEHAINLFTVISSTDEMRCDLLLLIIIDGLISIEGKLSFINEN